MALRFDIIDKDFTRRQTHLVLQMLMVVAKALGVTGDFGAFQETIKEIEDKNELPMLEDVIKALGGNGTVLQNTIR